jgi:hypothetical protein
VYYEEDASRRYVFKLAFSLRPPHWYYLFDSFIKLVNGRLAADTISQYSRYCVVMRICSSAAWKTAVYNNSKQRLGIQIDKADARQWLKAVAAQQAHVIDEARGIFGHRSHSPPSG